MTLFHPAKVLKNEQNIILDLTKSILLWPEQFWTGSVLLFFSNCCLWLISLFMVVRLFFLVWPLNLWHNSNKRVKMFQLFIFFFLKCYTRNQLIFSFIFLFHFLCSKKSFYWTSVLVLLKHTPFLQSTNLSKPFESILNYKMVIKFSIAFYFLRKCCSYSHNKLLFF